MLKVSENPPIIYPEGESIVDFDGIWWVVQTKSRQEKALAWDLLRKQVSYFLPMTWKVRKNKGRTLRSLLPLFSGYLFFCGQEHDRMEIIKTDRAANIIGVGNQNQLIEEILPIEKVIQSGMPIMLHEFMDVGQRCRVIAGPLKGTEGLITQTSKKARLVLQVEILGQSTSVQIDMDMVEKID